MLDKFRRARKDLATMNLLFPKAEQIARADGLDQPGAEHLLLAALNLDDGIAEAALATFDTDAAALHAAILDQHTEALREFGISADENAIDAALPQPNQPSGIYRAQGSTQITFQRAVALARSQKAALHSGHILAAATEPEHGTLARAIDHLGIDRKLLHHQATTAHGRPETRQTN